MTELLSRLISLLPDSPGVYLMKNGDGEIIYIGKAKSLKKRVSQYFLRPQIGKVKAMVSHVERFETILVSSDKEAFILEMNLIQTHHPRYNIMLMDDSHYPYLALKRGNDPVLRIARNKKDRRYIYFGPYPSSSSASSVLSLLNKIFPTRKCRLIPKKPCLYYSLGQCLAPCLRKVDEQEAEALCESIKRFLGGDAGEEKAKLREKMAKASERLDFETALECKKTLDSIDHVLSSQRVEFKDLPPTDVFAYSSREGYFALAVLNYRNGCLLGKKSFVVSGFLDPESQMLDLIEQYYSSRELPKQAVLRLENVKSGLQDDFGEEMKVIVPSEGRLLDLVYMAELNAKNALDEYFLSSRLEDDNLALIEELGGLLGIKTPTRIELFDNSHLQGDSPVAAMVCYINGVPERKMYRKFRLSESSAGDDYASMREVVGRRYSRLIAEGEPLPSLILTDGGLTQVRAAKEGLSLAKADIPVFGLRKNSRHQTDALVDELGNAFPLNQDSPLFFLLMRMQDEVHRFAISFHRDKRSKSQLASELDNIAGIGEKTKNELIKHFKSLKRAKTADLEELEKVIGKHRASVFYNHFHPAGSV